MVELRKITSADAGAVLSFELENRVYFAQTVSDRGDDFFERFAHHHDVLLAEQAAGTCVFHVLVEADGRVIGRVNLYDLDHESAEIGYRLAERAVGRGVATDAVERVSTLARHEYGLKALVAKVSDSNVASRRVLEKAGFARIGSAQINGKPAGWYERDLRNSRSSV